jgi:DNA-binding CsgD family transcriptional regulator
MHGPDATRVQTGDDAGQGGLIGRSTECDLLDQLLVAAHVGRGRALVVRGEAGSGKTALLDYLQTRASECQIVRVAGVESESDCAHAALHRLCTALQDRTERLPGPQRGALEAAFGLRDSCAPDRFLTGMAVLSLLSDTSAAMPLVCLVDDAQWLDAASSQALGFAARRLGAGSTALVIAVREPDVPRDCAGLPELTLQPLGREDSRELLGSRLIGPVDPDVHHRMAAESGGNPQRLLATARAQTPEQLAGGFGLPPAPAASTPGVAALRGQVDALAQPVRLLLSIAAAEPTGDCVLVWKAADVLGIRPSQETAAAAAIIDFGARARFRHPLGRSVAYWSASPAERRDVHLAIAAGIDRLTDPGRHAWHLAHASTALDENVAAAVEHSADSVAHRGGLQAHAAFREHAAALTPGSELRARRSLAAADLKYRAGAAESALRLLTVAQAGPLDDLGRGQADLLEARVAAVGGLTQSAWLLLRAARHLEALDPSLAREGYRDALHAVLAAGRLADENCVYAIARAVQTSAVQTTSATGGEEARTDVASGLATLITEGPAAGAPVLRQALGAISDPAGRAETDPGWLPLGCRAARDLWDHATWSALSGRLIEAGRRGGALAVLPAALQDAAVARVLAGDFAAAAGMAREAQLADQATGRPTGPYGSLAHAAWSGAQDEVERLAASSTPGMVARDEGQWLTATRWATALLGNSLGQYERALAAAQDAAAEPLGLGPAAWALAELVEAAARTGSPERARDALARLGEIAEACGTDWACGLLARSQALATVGAAAEEQYREAITLLDRAALPTEAARARLVYGEWLRRGKRRTDARTQLRAAHQTLAGIGAAGFASRAKRELTASGETIRNRTPARGRALTVQEAQSTRLAADGLTNGQIGATLFLSPRTVEYHLRKAYGKLGVKSRRELKDVL